MQCAWNRPPGKYQLQVPTPLNLTICTCTQWNLELRAPQRCSTKDSGNSVHLWHYEITILVYLTFEVRLTESLNHFGNSPMTCYDFGSNIMYGRDIHIYSIHTLHTYVYNCTCIIVVTFILVCKYCKISVYIIAILRSKTKFVQLWLRLW